MSPGLHRQARLALLALAGATVLGWPLKVFQDILRASRRLVASAMAEMVAYVAFGAGSITCALEHGPLWVLIGLGGAIPLFIGMCAGLAFAASTLEHRFRPGLVDRESLRRFSSISAYLFLLGISNFIVYSIDRLILAIFRPASVVGLYEGPVRVHNLVRQLSGSLNLLVLPTAAAYLESGDRTRARELLLRGTRYSVAVTVPVTIALMVMAKPILVVWLGHRFAPAATALAILIAYWLVASSTAVAAPMLIAAGRVRSLVLYAAAISSSNLALSLALTPWLGLDGVVLGTTVPYILCAPMILVLTTRTFEVSWGDFARRAWRPVFALAVPFTGLIVLVRLTVPLHSVVAVAGTLSAAVLAFWVAFYALYMDAGERRLVRSLAGRR